MKIILSMVIFVLNLTAYAGCSSGAVYPDPDIRCELPAPPEGYEYYCENKEDTCCGTLRKIK